MTLVKPGCMSCDIVAGTRTEPGGTLYENAHWYVGMFMGPAIWPGFMIIKVKRHCEQIAQLTPDEAKALGPTLKLATEAVSQVLNPAKVYVCSFGDGVKHVHFWILPRPQTMRAGMHTVIFNLDWRLFCTKRLHIKRWLLSDEETIQLADSLKAAFST